MMMLRALISGLMIVWAGVALAEVKISGSFVASTACEAVQSIKKGTNPGNIALSVGSSYAVFAKNKDAATHYQIDVPGAAPSRRWVAITCGTLDGIAAPPPAEQAGGSAPDYILAISWQPAFCESHPDKTECATQNDTRYDASHFTLHGLWPQPRSNINCSITAEERQALKDKAWARLPALSLSAETRASLDEVMPGAQSFLDRYEWTKHGTCYPTRNPETYYRDSVRLMREINASLARDFLAANVGKEVKLSDFRAKFDESFGAGAGDRLRVACDRDGDRLLMVEMTLGLRGNISSGASLKDLMRASAPTEPGCPVAVVDRVGLQ